ncbi:PrgI family mobile element protein [Patescibacteria group bacterium]
MQFIVPQFIDVEDKILGPISVRQFVTLLVGAGLIYADYELIWNLNNNFWAFAIAGLFIFAFTLVVAFLKINGQLFHTFLLNFLISMRDPHMRVWNKKTGHIRARKAPEIELPQVTSVKAPLRAPTLNRLALIVDTGGAYQEEDNEPITLKESNLRASELKDKRLVNG